MRMRGRRWVGRTSGSRQAIPLVMKQVRHSALELGRRPMPDQLNVSRWTGREVRALREARRMSVRGFAEYLGVSDRMVSKWEAGGTAIVPRPFNQQLLDVALERADRRERERFIQLLTRGPEPLALSLGPRPALSPVPKQPLGVIVQRTLSREDMRTAMAGHDIAGMYRILQRYGVSQRQIAAATEQSQSEISEILGGRRVVTYELLLRIAEGLGVPRAFMGLAGSPLEPS
jgi:transcriptional regulator with XRE-family HTH domain